MKLFYIGKDGGKESNVTGYWLIEWKPVFSIALLKFEHGSRDAFHSHAFNCISWVLKGLLKEKYITGAIHYHRPTLRPIITRRSTFHQVFSFGTTWVLTFRGPWVSFWREYNPLTKLYSLLNNGRKIVKEQEEIL